MAVSSESISLAIFSVTYEDSCTALWCEAWKNVTLNLSVTVGK